MPTWVEVEGVIGVPMAAQALVRAWASTAAWVRMAEPLASKALDWASTAVWVRTVVPLASKVLGRALMDRPAWVLLVRARVRARVVGTGEQVESRVDSRVLALGDLLVVVVRYVEMAFLFACHTSILTHHRPTKEQALEQAWALELGLTVPTVCPFGNSHFVRVLTSDRRCCRWLIRTGRRQCGNIA